MGREFPFNPSSGEPPLEQLVDEIFLKVKAQARLAGQLSGNDWEADCPSAADIALTILKRRRSRDELFGFRLFGEPIWDMLLDLFAHANVRRKVSVSSLCIASAVPPTTALRHLKVMESHGMITRYADPQDSRRVFVEMSPECHARMDQLLGSWNSGGGTAA
nr:hypothetical protein [Sphingomonas sp. CDS-1]